MFLKAVFPMKYIQGPGVARTLPDHIKELGNRAFIIPTRSASRTVLEDLQSHLPADTVIETFCGECHERELERLASGVEKERANVVVGIGGGKAIDTAKVVADRTHNPVIIVPTIASTDAPCSGCAIIYDEDGVFDTVSSGGAVASYLP